MAYQWLGSDGTVLNTTDTLSFPTLRQSDQGEYFCVVTVGDGGNQFVGCTEHSVTVGGESSALD